MQEAIVGGWAQESHLSSEMQRTLRDMNHRFLDLAVVRGEWVAVHVAPLSAAQRSAAAGCPYALFDLRFRDDAYWRLRLQNSDAWRVADEAGIDDETMRFVRLALFYAWHVASGQGLKAQLLLGMNFNTVNAFRRITLNQLSALMPGEAGQLSARWSGCGAYWRALALAAASTDPAALRRVQLYGLQLAAGARLPDP
jgi:hypothetical protein